MLVDLAGLGRRILRPRILRRSYRGRQLWRRRPRPVEPVDWELAGRVARRIAGPDPFSGSYLASPCATSSSGDHEAEALVREFTGLERPGPATATVLDRSAWVDANLASMRRLLAPLSSGSVSASLTARSGRRPYDHGTELGVLLGCFSRRVLGQYDLLVPDEAGGDDADARATRRTELLGLEKRFGFRPATSGCGSRIHEVTHRAQFTGVPWMRGYFLSLVEESLAIIEPDPGRLGGPGRGRRYGADAIRSTTAGSSPCWPRRHSVAPSPACRPSCRCSRVTATAS